MGVEEVRTMWVKWREWGGGGERGRGSEVGRRIGIGLREEVMKVVCVGDSRRNPS